MTNFSDLLGKTIIEIDGLHDQSDRVTFHTADKKSYAMYHSQDCCESVSINDIVGDAADLFNSPILKADERSNQEESYRSATWTFYELATVKGSVTIRWLGESNGYYSEEVDFKEITKP